MDSTSESTNECEWEASIMSKDKKKKDNKKSTQAETNQGAACSDTDELRNQELYTVPASTIRILKGMGATCVTLFLAIMGVVGWIGVQVYELNGVVKGNSVAIDSIKEEISDIRGELEGIRSDIKDINVCLYGESGNGGIVARLAVVESKLGIPIISASNDAQAYIGNVSIEYNDREISSSPFSADMPLGTDQQGNVYLAEDLIGQTILLVYTEDDKEIFFLGQYNDAYKWDGYCVTNAYYSDGTLYGICESNFDSGKRLDYKSFVTSDSGDWILSNKICDGDKNLGTNITYDLKYDKIKNFTSTSVQMTDILYVDVFLKTVNATMTKYYSGETLNSLFDDDTGDAYEVIYNSDGTVKTLYVGRFSKGYFNDSTGDAWDISYAGEYGYVWNTGEFEDGLAVNASSKMVSLDEINQIISGYKFDCELRWKKNE